MDGMKSTNFCVRICVDVSVSVYIELNYRAFGENEEKYNRCFSNTKDH